MMTYHIVSRKNPITKVKKFYPALISPVPMNNAKIIERIEKKCTLASSDVKAVVDALEVEIIDCLQAGLSVRLGDLGSFRASLRSKGAAKAEDVVVGNIMGVHVVFTPSGKMRRALSVKNGMIKFLKQGEKTVAPNPGIGG
ncbi:HU family DNA-binding protein [Alloprevotella sp. OH1205_COT-284]|uniref:HU family DNA-binding protein n=1 Tax=Alloprevotella sp. OH1205_COT-284 TaxID=2491043 RepID=UPI00131537E0|nr:HU family DNA-binding protein [Alloprevotella sp. OH1205_COT-284]